MVPGQAPVYDLNDVSTIEKWQRSLTDKNNTLIAAAGRFKRYDQLIDENYGKITVEKGIDFVSDRIDPYTGKERGWTDPIPKFNDCTTVCMYFNEDNFAEEIPYYKSDKKGPIIARIGNLWSLVAVPAEGDLHLAMTDFPAQRGGFVHFNLLEELDR